MRSPGRSGAITLANPLVWNRSDGINWRSASLRMVSECIGMIQSQPTDVRSSPMPVRMSTS